MLIPIKRTYLNSGLETDILVNTNYIIKIESTENDVRSAILPRTRLVMDERIERESVSFIYTTYTIAYIKGLLTKAHNKDQEVEG